MGRYRRGDVVLVLFPFQQYDGFKKRPALILEEIGDKEYAICQITSTMERASIPGNVALLAGTQEFKDSGLAHSSVINFQTKTIVSEVAIYMKLGRFALPAES